VTVKVRLWVMVRVRLRVRVRVRLRVRVWVRVRICVWVRLTVEERIRLPLGTFCLCVLCVTSRGCWDYCRGLRLGFGFTSGLGFIGFGFGFELRSG
jgi:hypothetical protein